MTNRNLITNEQEKRTPDYIMLFSVFLLIGIGIIMILSSSPAVGFDHFNDSYYFVKRHSIYVFLGLFAFAMGSFIDYNLYKKWAMPGMIFTLFLLILTYIPGLKVNTFGASRWVNAGFFTFQPSEIAKLAVIFFVATSIENKRTKIRSFLDGLLPVLMVVGFLSLFILMQPDLGTTVLIVFITFTMLYAAGAKTWHIFILSLIGARVATWVIMHNPYQKERVLAFLNPWKDSLGIGFHIIQSWLAVGSGGLLGLGLGNSRQKFFYLPQQFTDFIFAILCEEGGFIIASTVIILFGIFIWRGIIISSKAPTFFAKYTALGIITWLSLQAIINICVVLGLLPTTGIPLTFISFGGTSLVVNLFAVGILNRIAFASGDNH